MYFTIIDLITVISGTSGGRANYSLQTICLVTVDFTGFVGFGVILGFFLFEVVVVGMFVSCLLAQLDVVDTETWKLQLM